MGDNQKGQKLMDILRRIIGIVLIVIGAVVAAHMIIEPLYHVSSEASPNSPIWNIIDPFHGVGGRAGRDIQLHPQERR